MVWLILVWLVKSCWVWLNLVWWGWICLVWLNLVCFGWIWFRLVESGLVWFGLVWYGWTWFGWIWLNLVWYSLVWFGMVVFVWLNLFESSLVWLGLCPGIPIYIIMVSPELKLKLHSLHQERFCSSIDHKIWFLSIFIYLHATIPLDRKPLDWKSEFDQKSVNIMYVIRICSLGHLFEIQLLCRYS